MRRFMFIFLVFSFVSNVISDYPGYEEINNPSGYLEVRDTTFFLNGHPKILYHIKDCDSAVFENCNFISTLPVNGNGNMVVGIEPFDEPCPTAQVKKVTIKNCIIQNFSFLIHGPAPDTLIIDSCNLLCSGSKPYSQGVYNELIDISWKRDDQYFGMTNCDISLTSKVDHALYGHFSSKPTIVIKHNNFYVDSCNAILKVSCGTNRVYYAGNITVDSNSVVGYYGEAFVLFSGCSFYKNIQIIGNQIDTSDSFKWGVWNTTKYKTKNINNISEYIITPTTTNNFINEYQ